MAVLQAIPCNGICYEYQGEAGKFCTLVDLPVPAEYSKRHYLFLTASSAAERVIYGKEDEDPAKSDRVSFANPGAPPLGECIKEAQAIFSRKKPQIKGMVAQIKAKMRQADYDIGLLPKKTLNDKTYAVLLSKEEIEAVANQP
jgi:hypothetical protein